MALLSQECKKMGGEAAASSVICAVITQWTAHYLAYSWLITLKNSLTVIITADAAWAQYNLPSKIITGNQTAKTKT